jgi:hypothetical protein
VISTFAATSSDMPACSANAITGTPPGARHEILLVEPHHHPRPPAQQPHQKRLPPMRQPSLNNPDYRRPEATFTHHTPPPKDNSSVDSG